MASEIADTIYQSAPCQACTSTAKANIDKMPPTNLLSLQLEMRRAIYEQIFEQVDDHSYEIDGYIRDGFFGMFTPLSYRTMMVNASDAATSLEIRQYFLQRTTFIVAPTLLDRFVSSHYAESPLHGQHAIRGTIRVITVDRWTKGLFTTNVAAFQKVIKSLRGCPNLREIVLHFSNGLPWPQCWITHSLKMLHRLLEPLTAEVETEVRLYCCYEPCSIPLPDDEIWVLEYNGHWSSSWEINKAIIGYEEDKCGCGIGVAEIEAGIETGIELSCKLQHIKRSVVSS